MKSIDIQQVNTGRNPIMIYDDTLNIHEANKPCQEKIDKANSMLKKNNVFNAVKAIKANEKITKP
ncbi:MAG: hypothetical protein IPN79_15585 [Saprospiraceae bacterium]|nr:hypothetical protein [Saprospiraceae bacterium]